MIVPIYWSESKTKKVINDKSFTIKRFGWSDDSELDAKAHAEQRLKEAVAILDKEGDVRRIDHKVSYNGAEGVPIREEVIEKHGDVVLSRNSYGALCLNTPDVMFADIDFDRTPSPSITYSVTLFFAILSVSASVFYQSWWVFILSAFVAMIATMPISNFINKIKLKKQGGLEKISLNTIEHVSAQTPDLHLRLYKTPNGYRILVMNDTYEPVSDKAISILKALNSDKTYIQMCKNQKCFRARVSPKPWRIGVDRLRPRPGVWPIKPEKLQQRNNWVTEYNEASKNYRSCYFVKHIGSHTTTEKTERVRDLHDTLCNINNDGLKIA